VKFETTPAFDHDVRHLKREHLAEFLTALRIRFIPAGDARGADPAMAWPQSLRVKSVQGAPGVLEMTWSFVSPDGQATFEFVTVDGELRLRWRRVGDHDVFKRP
jgi:hypothetical protein